MSRRCRLGCQFPALSWLIITTVGVFGPVSYSDAADVSLTGRFTSPIYNWTGLYAGGSVGYQSGWGSGAVLITGGSTFVQERASGFFGSALAGYNWEIPAWDQTIIVVGLELDGSGASSKESRAVTLGAETFQVALSIPWNATIRGRIGAPIYWLSGLLVYGIAGGGVERISSTATARGPVLGSLKGTSERAVWVVGGGIEFAVSRYVSWRLEYNYLETGTVTDITPVGPGGIALSTGRITEHAVDAGIVFHF